MKLKQSIGLAFAFLGVWSGAQAGVQWDATGKVIRVTGFPADRPATLNDLRQADQQGGWNLVRYEASNDTYEIQADLILGEDTGTTNCLLIGSAEHPRETLVLRGRLTLMPVRTVSYISATYTGLNRLQLGLADQPDIQPALIFDCSRRGEFGLKIGDTAQLLAYHAALAARELTPNRYASWQGCGRYTRVVGCRIAGFTELYAFGAGYGAETVEDTVFEHIDCGLGNGIQWCRNCVFRDMGNALSDGGGLYATLINCRFERNQQHWSLQHTSRGILAVDCVFDTPKLPGPTIRRWQNPETGVWNTPVFISQRHWVFKVTDAAGRPLPNARVTLTGELESPGAVQHGTALTGPDGQTPPASATSALLVTDLVLRATPKDNAPERIANTFQARVEAKGFQTVILKGLRPEPSAPAQTVSLQRAWWRRWF